MTRAARPPVSTKQTQGGGGPDDAPAVPPPGAQLQAALAVMQPVRTRRPWLAAAIVLGAAALRPLHSLIGGGLRPDFADLPWAWRALAPLPWAAGLLFALLVATVPRRGAVLPDVARAGRAIGGVAVGLLAFGLFATVDGPATIVPAGGARELAFLWWHCTGYSVLVI